MAKASGVSNPWSLGPLVIPGAHAANPSVLVGLQPQIIKLWGEQVDAHFAVCIVAERLFLKFEVMCTRLVAQLRQRSTKLAAGRLKEHVKLKECVDVIGRSGVGERIEQVGPSPSLELLEDPAALEVDPQTASDDQRDALVLHSQEQLDQVGFDGQR